MSPRRDIAPAVLGLLAGLAVSLLGQACEPACGDVEPLRFHGGDFAWDSSWGAIGPHPMRPDITAELDLREETLTVRFDSDEGLVEERWELGRIEGW
jgi:hypothetical protein